MEQSESCATEPVTLLLFRSTTAPRDGRWGYYLKSSIGLAVPYMGMHAVTASNKATWNLLKVRYLQQSEGYWHRALVLRYRPANALI